MEDDKVTAAPATPAAITKEQSEAAAQAAQTAGAEAERVRVRGILTHAEAAGRTKLAEHLALETAIGVEAAGKMLAASPKEATAPANPLAAAMPANPKVGADDPKSGDPTEAQPVIDSTAIYKAREAARLALVK